MNKPYFAKWIEVEGEIKEGDFILDSLGVRKVETTQGVEAIKDARHIKKVKIFLCSRDNYKEGELFYDEQFPNLGIQKARWETPYMPKEQVKVLGEVSPNALSYMKEGDEFDEDQLGFIYHNKCVSTFITETNMKNALALVANKIWSIGIKGPCTHFH